MTRVCHIFKEFINFSRPACSVWAGLLLLLVREVFHYVFHPAVEDSAKHVDGMGADKFVSLQAGDLARADAVAVNQGILGYPFFAHGFPQATIRNHARVLL